MTKWRTYLLIPWFHKSNRVLRRPADCSDIMAPVTPSGENARVSPFMLAFLSLPIYSLSLHPQPPSWSVLLKESVNQLFKFTSKSCRTFSSSNCCCLCAAYLVGVLQSSYIHVEAFLQRLMQFVSKNPKKGKMSPLSWTSVITIIIHICLRVLFRKFHLIFDFLQRTKIPPISLSCLQSCRVAHILLILEEPLGTFIPTNMLL